LFWVTKWQKITPKQNNAGYSRFVRWKCFKPVLHSSSLIFLIISGSSFFFNFRNQKTSKTGIAKSLVPLFCQIFLIKGPSVLSFHKNCLFWSKNRQRTGGLQEVLWPFVFLYRYRSKPVLWFFEPLVKSLDGFFELNKTVGRGSISSTLFFLQKRELPNTGFNLLQCHMDSNSVLYKSTPNYEARRAYVSCRPETCKKTHKFHSSQTRVNTSKMWGQIGHVAIPEGSSRQCWQSLLLVNSTWPDMTNHVNLISELDLGSWWTARTFGKGQQNVHNCIKQQANIENHSQSPSLDCSMCAKFNYRQNFHTFATTKLRCPNQSIDHCF
jgi:hypothetical protein